MISCVFAVVVSIALPMGAAIYLVSKKKGYLKPVLLGALTFVVFQMIIRVPILQGVLPNMQWFILMTSSQSLLTALFLGGTAALAEIGGRYLIMTLFMKNRRRFCDGLAFGIGHGGIEAILIVGINIILALIISGGTDSNATTLTAGLERIFTMISQTAWSVMVLTGIKQQKIGWVLLAFGLHMLMDSLIVVMSAYNMSVFIIEAVLATFAAVMLVYLFSEYKKQRRVV